MKYNNLLTIAILLLLQSAIAQQTISYSLENDFNAEQAGEPALIPLANNSGQTGNFQTVPQPANFCPGGGDMTAHHFADNAGFAFDNSNGFLDCEYTIELLFKYDALPSLFESPWVFFFGFEPGQDSGLFFEFNPLFGTTFDVWRNNDNPMFEPYSFNVNDWQKLTVVRDCDGMVRFYKGCTLFKVYDDSVNEILLADEDQIIFFQDDPTVLVAEAQPGLVRNVRFSNFAMTPAEVTLCCDNICNDLVENCLVETVFTIGSCDLDEVGVDSIVYETPDCDSLVIITTEYLGTDNIYINETTCDPDLVGVKVEEWLNSSGCDSIVVITTTYEEVPVFEYEQITCNPEESGVDSFFYDCDSIVIFNLFLLVIDTTFFPTIAVPAGNTIVIFGETVTQPGTYCQTLSSVDGCDSTSCQQVDWLVATSEPIRSDGLYMPNAFSPNGDGVNDFFTVYGGNDIQRIDCFRIFNRQGQLLFERKGFLADEESMGWDGTYRGREMEVGGYVFMVEFDFGKKSANEVGSFTLVR
ncbi:MAG: gliding motility-associated-like protein [Saprospiraceae bacterium]|jgi:gliding motility-associated-like protein